MFLVALLMIVQKWNQSKCPSTDELVNKMWCIHALEYSSIKRNEILIYSVTWKNLEVITVNERKQTQKPYIV